MHSLFFGFNDFVHAIESKNIPFAVIVAVIVLTLKLISGLLVITNIYTNYAVTSLIIFVILATILYHNAFVDNGHFNNMLKNIALIGGLILLYK